MIPATRNVKPIVEKNPAVGRNNYFYCVRNLRRLLLRPLPSRERAARKAPKILWGEGVSSKRL
jgi:hypothetical protein